MSTDATTTEGFRVGRRVMICDHESSHYGKEGRINAETSHPNVWYVAIEGYRPQFRESDLALLPDDAPATPEPRFKIKDEVEVLYPHACQGQFGRILGQPEPGIWYVNLDNMLDRSDWTRVPDDCLKAFGDDEPGSDSKPSYYARLREAGCEPFAVIRGCMSREKAVAYHQGTAIAYLIRAEHKHDSPGDDIRKAHAHLAEAVAILNGKA